jgi:flagellar M-ring protein FliF
MRGVTGVGLQKIAAIWQGLDLRGRAIVVVATLATFAAVLTLGQAASRPTMALLYAGIDGASAGSVLTALEQRGADYEVRGSAIYVPAARRDELRMALAGDGLPPSGGTGYELLDSLSGFGTTAQMFDAAYWRAKEGELARTISSNTSIRSARVHISPREGRGLRPGDPPRASVTVTTGGSVLPRPQVEALRFLVASAVAGLSPENVAVIDSQRGLIPGDASGMADGAGDGRQEELRQNVERLLAARVGPGHAVVEVAIDTVTDRESITERKFDPQGRVQISSDTEEKQESSTDKGGGAVTVASNLPDGKASGSDRSAQSQNKEVRERANFEVSETTREVVRVPGTIRRLTVAVLIDGIKSTDGAGQETWTPRPDDELAALRDLVASAVGFDEGRGDVITIKSLQFDIAPPEGEAAPAGLLAALDLDLMRIIQLGVLAVVALVLGLFVLRPVLMRPAPALPPPSAALPAPSDEVLTGEIDDGTFLPGGMNMMSSFPAMGAPGLPSPGDGDESVARLRRLVEERQDEAVSVLRSWMEDSRKEEA